MIIVQAPLKRTHFQQIDFAAQLGGDIPYAYPSASPSQNVDEIVVSNSTDGDLNQIDFIKRYDTWFVFTDVQNFPLLPYKITFIRYDRTNRIAFTYTDNLKIIRQP